MKSQKKILQRQKKLKYHYEVSQENYASNNNEISYENLIRVKKHKIS